MPNGRLGRPGRLILSLSSALVIAVATPALVGADPQPTLAEVQSQVDVLHGQAEQATERYNAATEQLIDVQRRLASAQADVERQRAKLAELIRNMGGFAAASYRTGGMDPTMQVFLAEDPAEFLSQASVVDAYASQQAGALRTVALERQRLAEQQVTADEEQARLEALEAELATQKKDFESKLEEAERLLKRLTAADRARLDRERAAREQASRSAARTAAAAVPASGRGAVAVRFALAQVGEPYRFGGTGPSSWDCSGLTMMAWREAGISIPRVSSAQLGAGSRVSKANLQPGDLVFYYSPISHVAIYIGNGQIVHATHPGDVVSVDPLGSMPYSGAARPG